MLITTEAERVVYSQLSEEQWKAGRAWMNTSIVNCEYWRDDHSKLALHKPTPQQAEEFTALLEKAG